MQLTEKCSLWQVMYRYGNRIVWTDTTVKFIPVFVLTMYQLFYSIVLMVLIVMYQLDFVPVVGEEQL